MHVYYLHRIYYNYNYNFIVDPQATQGTRPLPGRALAGPRGACKVARCCKVEPGPRGLCPFKRGTPHCIVHYMHYMHAPEPSFGVENGPNRCFRPELKPGPKLGAKIKGRQGGICGFGNGGNNGQRERVSG